jgi:hypothetical protein
MSDEVGRIAAVVLPTVTYKPGWAFRLGGPLGQFVCIHAATVDSNDHARTRSTQHMFELPVEVTDEPAFVRWLFDRLLLCEQHEAGEFFKVAGFARFYPHHQDQGSPYDLVDHQED